MGNYCCLPEPEPEPGNQLYRSSSPYKPTQSGITAPTISSSIKKTTEVEVEKQHCRLISPPEIQKITNQNQRNQQQVVDNQNCVCSPLQLLNLNRDAVEENQRRIIANYHQIRTFNSNGEEELVELVSDDGSTMLFSVNQVSKEYIKLHPQFNIDYLIRKYSVSKLLSQIIIGVQSQKSISLYCTPSMSFSEYLMLTDGTMVSSQIIKFTALGLISAVKYLHTKMMIVGMQINNSTIGIDSDGYIVIRRIVGNIRNAENHLLDYQEIALFIFNLWKKYQNEEYTQIHADAPTLTDRLKNGQICDRQLTDFLLQLIMNPVSIESHAYLRFENGSDAYNSRQMQSPYLPLPSQTINQNNSILSPFAISELALLGFLPWDIFSGEPELDPQLDPSKENPQILQEIIDSDDLGSFEDLMQQKTAYIDLGNDVGDLGAGDAYD